MAKAGDGAQLQETVLEAAVGVGDRAEKRTADNVKRFLADVSMATRALL